MAHFGTFVWKACPDYRLFFTFRNDGSLNSPLQKQTITESQHLIKLQRSSDRDGDPAPNDSSFFHFKDQQANIDQEKTEWFWEAEALEALCGTVPSSYDREAAPVKCQQQGCLNKTWAIPMVDSPLKKGEKSQGPPLPDEASNEQLSRE